MRVLGVLLLLLGCATARSETLPEAYTALRQGNFDRAFVLFTAAANQGSAEARFQLGKLYLAGRGTAKNAEQGQFWLKLAADDGLAGAQYSLGLLLMESGSDEPGEGVRWLQRAADGGHQQAQTRLDQLAQAVAIETRSAEELSQRWLEASVNCRSEELEALVGAGADPNSRDEYQRTALHYLAACDDPEGLRLGLALGLNPVTRDQFGESALGLAVKRDALTATALLLAASSGYPREQGLLHLAVASGSAEMLEILLADKPPLNAINEVGETPLDLAIRLEKHSAQQVLVAAGASASGAATLPSPDITPWEAARLAVLQQRPDSVEALVRTHGDALLREEDVRGRTLLMYAVEASAEGVVRTLIELGAAVDQLNSEGVSALTLAAAAGNQRLVRALLAAGADPLQAGTGDDDVVLVALERGKSDEVAALLLDVIGESALSRQRASRYLLSATRHDAQASIGRLLHWDLEPDLMDLKGRTATWYSAQNCDDRTLLALLDSSFSPSVGDAAGRTPLHQAAGAGCLGTISLLLQAGADPVLTTHQGNTALMLAVQQGKLVAARALVNAGASISDTNQSGDTPLIQAVRLGSLPLVDLLLEQGADPYRRNELGVSAIGLAKRTSPELARLMASKYGLPF